MGKVTEEFDYLNIDVLKMGRLHIVEDLRYSDSRAAQKPHAVKKYEKNQFKREEDKGNIVSDFRSIVHMDLDTFFVSCECRLLDRKLIRKSVLIGGTSDRGGVASCSYEARSFGVYSAMPMRMARQLCPEAIVVRGKSGIYSKFSNNVIDIIKESVPL